jgi:hypothetical protein
MLGLLAFAILAVALAAPFVVPLMWGQIESNQDEAAAAKDCREPSTTQSARASS